MRLSNFLLLKTAFPTAPQVPRRFRMHLFLPPAQTEIWISGPIHSAVWPQSSLETGHLPPLSLIYLLLSHLCFSSHRVFSYHTLLGR